MKYKKCSNFLNEQELQAIHRHIYNKQFYPIHFYAASMVEESGKWFPILPTLHKPGTQPCSCRRCPCFLLPRGQMTSCELLTHSAILSTQLLAAPPFNLLPGGGKRVPRRQRLMHPSMFCNTALPAHLHPPINSFLPVSLITSL